MQLTFKLYASLAAYLPDDADKHSVSISIDASDTAHSILERYNVPRESAHLILLNGVYVQPAQREQSIFKEGDTLAIWPPVAGG